jgi:hypothetical protein
MLRENEILPDKTWGCQPAVFHHPTDDEYVPFRAKRLRDMAHHGLCVCE